MADREYDVVVLGSGAAGLTAALTAADHGARVLVVEKGAKVGGTSAWSGGQIWIPCNPHQEAFGKEDSRDKALTYLESMSNGLIDPKMAETYVDTGPEMVAYLEANTPVPFMVVPHFPDYHAEQPGAASRGGRTLECRSIPMANWANSATRSRLRLTIGRTSISPSARRRWRRPYPIRSTRQNMSAAPPMTSAGSAIRWSEGCSRAASIAGSSSCSASVGGTLCWRMARSPGSS